MADNSYSNGLTKYLEEGTKNLRNFVTSSIYSGNSTEIDRVTRYYLFWKFYKGEHYRDYNDSMIAFNYVRAFIDKINYFVVGEKSISFKAARYDGDVVDEEISGYFEKLILKNWNKNKLDELIQEILQMGAITGDVWVGVNWWEEKGCCKIMCCDSRYCFPEFSATKGASELERFSVRQPVEKDTEGYTVLVTEYTKDFIYQYKRNNTSNTPYAEGQTNTKLLSKVPNALKKIPIVHIKNKPSSESYFGTSDANDIMKLNKVYNEVAQEMKVVVDYQTSPVTIVTGATMKNMKRSVGNIWSGLPPEANVFNLSSDADLSGISEYLKMIKNGMHEIGDVPENVLGKIQAISGTSAAALKLTYQPLVHQAQQKALMYGNGIESVNELIFAHYEVYGKKDALYKKITKIEIEDYKVEAVFSYGFPSDKMVQLQEMQIEQQLHLNSRRNQMNELGYDNVEGLMSEIDTERLQQAQVQSSINELIGVDNAEDA